MCIAFSRNAGPHSLVACYSVFKDRATPLDAEPSSVSSLDGLVGVARTTGLLQGGRRIYIRCPGSSSALLRFLQPELHRTARGRCLDQPLRPVKPTAEPCSAVLLARGATSTPLPSFPSSTLATFFFVASCSEGCCFYPPSGFPVKHLGDFPSSPSVLAKGAASTPSRDAASTSQPCCLAALRCEGAFSRPSRLPRQG